MKALVIDTPPNKEDIANIRLYVGDQAVAAVENWCKSAPRRRDERLTLTVELVVGPRK